MKRCPRCHTTMIWASGAPEEKYAQLWHCLGCGREILADQEEQALDDTMYALHALRNTSQTSHRMPHRSEAA